MATPIRPGVQIPTPPQAQRADPARNAAQRAFFQAAMNATAAPSAPTATAAPRMATGPAPQHVQKVPTSLPAEPPTRILRPGSLLDIKV